MIEEIWTSLKVSNFIIRHWTDCSLSLSFSWSLFRILRWTDSSDGLRLAVGRFSSERRSGRCNRKTRSVDKKKLSIFDQKLLRITSKNMRKTQSVETKTKKRQQLFVNHFDLCQMSMKISKLLDWINDGINNSQDGIFYKQAHQSFLNLSRTICFLLELSLLKTST